MSQAAPIVRSLRELLAGLAPLPADDRVITGLTDDSRRVRRGDLFLAVQGLQRHGLEFLPAVRAAGAAAVAWEPPYRGELPAEDKVLLLPVARLGHQLGVIGGRFYGQPSRRLQLVGITGTDGKTSCAHFIAQALNESAECGLLGTLGYGVYGQVSPARHTTPSALTLQYWLAQLQARGVRHVVMEVSSHALEQGRVAGLDFVLAVLTNLTRDHLDYHGSLAAYAAAKRRLFWEHKPAVAVLNLDDPFGGELAASLPGSKVGYGFGKGAAIQLDGFLWGEDLELSATGLRLRVRSSWGEGTLSAGLLGRFNAHNLLAALASLVVLEIPFSEALERLSRVATVPGRMERLGGEAGQPVAVVDYAHTPHALEQVLAALREHACGRLWCVFGGGGDRDAGKRPLMGRVAERLADRMIITDDNPRTEDPQGIIRDILAGMANPDRAQVVRNRQEAIVRALSAAAPGDLVLIAGKGHEDYQLVGAERIPFSDRDVVRRWFGVTE